MADQTFPGLTAVPRMVSIPAQRIGETLMTFRIAVVQPLSHRPGEDAANVADAVQHVERAARDGAAFVCFPETYPGPWRMPATKVNIWKQFN